MTATTNQTPLSVLERARRDAASRRPATEPFVKPNPEEAAKRRRAVDMAMTYVLRPQPGDDAPWRSLAEFEDTETITGEARDAIVLMLELFPDAGTNSTTTAVQSAINKARHFTRKSGRNADTGVNPDTGEKLPFGLAMAWFINAMAEEGYAKNA